jgi:LPS sulfotransferase NodH
MRWTHPDATRRARSLPACVIAYEELVANPQAAVDKVASLFGLQGRAPMRAQDIYLDIQRDATTDDWRARLHAEYGNFDELDVV